jgi:hypothetical protein
MTGAGRTGAKEGPKKKDRPGGNGGAMDIIVGLSPRGTNNFFLLCTFILYCCYPFHALLPVMIPGSYFTRSSWR